MCFVANHHTDLEYSEQTTGILSSSIASLSNFLMLFVSAVEYMLHLFTPLNCTRVGGGWR